MSSLELKFSVTSESDVLAEGGALAPGKCLLCQKVQPKSAKNNEDPENKFFWVCCECRQIDSTDLLLGNDLKLGNIYDILGETRGPSNRYKSDIDSQAAQLMWVELRHTVRCIYRKAGTELAIDHMLDVEKMKSLVHKFVTSANAETLCERGPQQLYHQLETQGREYVEEVKFHLLEHLLCHPSSIGIPQHAREFAQTLLDEYEQLLCATITLQSFLVELEDEHMAKFGITWMLVNQHLFHQVVYSDPIIQKSLPGVCIQLKYGELQQASNTNSKFESYSSVYYRLKAFEEEMVRIEQQWIKAIVSLASFVNNEKVASSEKDHEEWEFLSRQHLIHARERAIKKNLIKDEGQASFENGDENLPSSLKGKFIFASQNSTKSQEDSDSNKEEKIENIPSSLLGHKKLFIKHTIPAPPIYPKTQLKAASEVLKSVKVDKLSSGSIEIKATRVEEDSSCVCDCAACTTLMDSLAANEPTDEESSPTEESSPLEKNWVHILNDIKDVGCDSSTQTIDDGEDRPSSERRLSTSSMSSKDSDKPKYCACCYCELVGHPNPSAQNSHNYEIFREKLRKKLEYKRNPEKARRELCAEHQNNFNLKVDAQSNNVSKNENDCQGRPANAVDNRSVEELVSFIEGKDGKETKRRKRKSKPKDHSKHEDARKESSSGPKAMDKADIQSETTNMDASPSLETRSERRSQSRSSESNLSSNQTAPPMCVETEMKADELEKEDVDKPLTFSFHLDKYDSLSKEQRALLLCGYRIDDHPMYRKQTQQIESMKLPREMMDRSNRNNMPNGKLMPTFQFLKTMDKEADLAAEPQDKTESEKAREAIIVETLKKERPKPEPSSKPKINVKEAYHGKNAGKPITLPKSAQRSKPVINSNTPYGPPPPPPKVNNVESKTISTKQVEQIKVIPAKSDSPKLDPIHKSPAPQKKVLLNQKPVELPKQTKENQLSTKQSVQTPTKPEQAPIDNRSVPAKGKALQGKVTKQPLKEARSDPAPKRPAEHKCVFKEESKAKEDDTSAKKKKFKKKKKRNESLDDIFLPKCEVDEMDYLDESERELEAFKRFCMDTQPLKTRQKIQLNWKNVNINAKKPI